MNTDQLHALSQERFKRDEGIHCVYNVRPCIHHRIPDLTRANLRVLDTVHMALSTYMLYW